MYSLPKYEKVHIPTLAKSLLRFLEVIIKKQGLGAKKKMIQEIVLKKSSIYSILKVSISPCILAIGIRYAKAGVRLPYRV